MLQNVIKCIGYQRLSGSKFQIIGPAKEMASWPTIEQRSQLIAADRLLPVGHVRYRDAAFYHILWYQFCSADTSEQLRRVHQFSPFNTKQCIFLI